MREVLDYIREKHRWIHPAPASWLERGRRVESETPPLTQDDLRFCVGVNLAMTPDEDSDPSDVFNAQQAASDLFEHLINHALWQGARIAALEAATPNDTLELIKARRRIAELEAAVSDAIETLGPVAPPPLQIGRAT